MEFLLGGCKMEFFSLEVAKWNIFWPFDLFLWGGAMSMTGREIYMLIIWFPDLRRICCRQAENLACSGSDDGMVFVWDPRTRGSVKTFEDNYQVCSRFSVWGQDIQDSCQSFKGSGFRVQGSGSMP